MARSVVRNLAANETHIANVTETHRAVSFGVAYDMPTPTTRALCGVHITDGVVMQPSTRVLCTACFDEACLDENGEQE